MPKPSDREYALHRKLRELEDQVRKKDIEIQQLKKKLDKLESKDKEYKPVKAKKLDGCPNCGSVIKTTELPFGTLQICSEACGWRKVDHGNN